MTVLDKFAHRNAERVLLARRRGAD